MFKHLLGCFNRSLFEVVLFKLCCINSFWLVIESREAPREPLLIPLPSASTTPPSSKLHHTQQVSLNKHVSQIFCVTRVFFFQMLVYVQTRFPLCRLYTPRLNDKTDSGKTHLQDLARWLRTSQRVDIPKISQFYWGLFEKTRFLCFYIIKSMARKGYFGPKSDFRGSKIPPRGASST